MRTHAPQSEFETKEVYNREEAAEFLGLSVATLDRLTKRNLIRANRATRRPLFIREELYRFLRENRNDAYWASRSRSNPKIQGGRS